jgi:hypothetical protein
MSNNKLSVEALGAARWQAIRGLDGSIGTRLPELLSVSAFNEINDNKAVFAQAVQTYRNALSRATGGKVELHERQNA